MLLYRIGDKGTAVKQIQQRLNELLGTRLVVDGLFGAKTEATVRSFQSSMGLICDGIVGTKTWDALFPHLIKLKKSIRKINAIILHCSATAEGKDYTVEDIRRWHLKRGFNDIGYHYVVYRDGSIHEGRDVNRTGAHTSGHNSHSIGICYIGGCDSTGKKAKDTRTAAQKATLRQLVNNLMSRYGLSTSDVYGHYHFANKACPSFRIEQLWE